MNSYSPVTERPYIRLIERAIAPSSSKDNNEEERRLDLLKCPLK
jgi:hypothetical protein